MRAQEHAPCQNPGNEPMFRRTSATAKYLQNEGAKDAAFARYGVKGLNRSSASLMLVSKAKGTRILRVLRPTAALRGCYIQLSQNFGAGGLSICYFVRESGHLLPVRIQCPAHYSERSEASQRGAFARENEDDSSDE